MAAPDELFCWEGDWGLPSVHTDCLVVLVSPLFGPDRTRLDQTGPLNLFADSLVEQEHTETGVSMLAVLHPNTG